MLSEQTPRTKLPWYEEVLVEAMKNHSGEAVVSDPSLSAADANDHERTVMSAISGLTNKWTSRNRFEQSSYGFCNELRDLTLQERRS
eukprot:CAMPEP_0113665150 /NCGR_PEP_ID=MMETSP0038_2-20120614/2142_1 /TAXON_ID=2898 /ORGANISM="Cryptomonas paramecium" /LENGTH=86 /DNA_ID=CAMNT_0000580465 /DNA_START=41 /DNA_END=298 /DNA_ORIENTATION=+ /assembly_acc=CAM_ASM_000170